MTDPVLTLDNLHVSVGSEDDRTTVVRGVSLDVHPGETVGLVGESGSGKTMTALGIVDLLPRTARIDSGRVLLAGTDVTALDARERRRVTSADVGVVFQNPTASLNPRLTISTQVVEALPRSVGSKRERRARAAELLDAVGIPDVGKALSAFPHELSGGLNQRVVIALALARSPKLLVADEPTTALDVSVQAQVLDLIDRLKVEFGLGVLLVSHDIGVIADRTSRVNVMNGGVVVESGATREVLSAPEQPYTRTLLAATPNRLVRPVTATPTVDSARPLVEVRDVRRAFAVAQPGKLRRVSHVALDGIDLAVQRGQSLGIVGESGSGKTTLARQIVGLDRPDAGSVVFEGADISTLDAHGAWRWRREVQYVFQDPYGSLNPRLTVEQSISEPLRYNDVDLGGSTVQARVSSLLDEVELPTAFRSRRPHELSGGQRQRVGIARALANEPSLIVADEPVSALDLSVQARILRLLQRLRQERGLTLMLISHDLAVVRYLCDDVVVLRHGTIVEQGATEDVYDDPKHEYTKALLNSVPGHAAAPVRA
ncbi:dipeptide ABC transporter ATP-binding protein [Rhodococcoides kyotonense]|uniref:Peptide/nickel transport system ATP-binding protein n=1 Tax=Rhodococcoides kyotonense TaxID=398843 RepID=A0A239GBW0_9NOCA|nr:ABC transporter ATP-binding protein [Rhodococcus kyotonensis]SNS65953.1 peptide/nickel transport system ATP-binding protein [Rhodococcus kyotonensis]